MRRHHKAIGGVPRNFKGTTLTMRKAIEDAKDAGARDADDVTYGTEPLNGKVYASEKAYQKAMGDLQTPEIAAAAIAAYRKSYDRRMAEYGAA